MKKILVIDDDKMVLDNITELLESEGFDVSQARNGVEGVEAAKKILPDLIISDVMMPCLDGFGVIKELSENPETANIPFIFLSARTDKSDFRLGMELGADDFLFKPFTPDDLFGTVNARIKKKSTVDMASNAKIKEFSMSIAANIPHELRTPLNGILASAQLLNDFYETLDKTVILEINSTILTSAKRLESLIYKYLLYVDTELILKDSEKLSMAAEYVTIFPTSIISEKAKKIGIKRQRDKDIEIDIIDSKLKIFDEHLKFIIEELLENSMKFSKSDTTIKVSTWEEDSKYYIQVTDEGIGMTAKEISNIGAMQQFERRIMEQQGLGLGLAIIQRMMNIYKGEISVESQKGLFTKVTIILQSIK